MAGTEWPTRTRKSNAQMGRANYTLDLNLEGNRGGSATPMVALTIISFRDSFTLNGGGTTMAEVKKLPVTTNDLDGVVAAAT
ncbi:MAG: hypothetical protein KGJ60_05825 [Verrucomicrobiota bacterium]|nr:hypothetical protein [Verrucomicrobiota bacterium]